MKVCIAIPNGSGQLPFQFFNSFLETVYLCMQQNIEIEFKIVPNLCYIDLARNMLVQAFLDSDCTDLLFIDDDLAWNAEAVVKILCHNEDIVCGIYPYKTDNESYPPNVMSNEEGQYILNEEGLIELSGAPTGFMRIKRPCLEKFIAEHPETKCSTFNLDGTTRNTFYNIFKCEQIGNAWWGEDFNFSTIFRASGVRIWGMPNIDFKHIGRKEYKGNYEKFVLSCQQIAKEVTNVP